MESMTAIVVACPDCDLLQEVPMLPRGGSARCPRCGRTVAANKMGSLDRLTALAVAALIVFVVANVEPLMGLSVSGLKSSTTILGGVAEMWRQGEWVAAMIIGLFVVVAPALYIGLMLAVLFLVRRPPAPRWVGTLLHWTETSGFWSMVEVMTLGILVALVKIASLARVEPGIGIFSVVALIVLMTVMAVGFDPAEIWSRVRWANGDLPPSSPEGGKGGGDSRSRARRPRHGRVSCRARRAGSWSGRPRWRNRGIARGAGRSSSSAATTPSRGRGRSSSPPRSATCRPTSCRS